MTIQEIMASDKACLTPSEIAPVIGCSTYSISIAARDCPERLSFPVIRIGTRTKIPRIPFLRAMGYEVDA